MCLTTDMDKEPPTRDRVFWKVVTTSRRPIFFSGSGVVYKKGKTISVKNGVNLQGCTLYDGSKLTINGNAIHCYTGRKKARMTRILESGELIIKVLCKKEDFIAWGMRDDVCYRKVTVLT